MAKETRRRATERQAAWQAICPPLYRKTDPARLPQGPLAQVMAWEYGAQGLILLGATGTGKTRAAYLLLRRLLDEGRSIRAFDALSFGHECVRRFREGTGETWADKLATVDVLLLDDLGKCPLTERVEAELFCLIERRCANERPLIATSSMMGEDLETKASADRGPAIVRRLREFCDTVVFPGNGT